MEGDLILKLDDEIKLHFEHFRGDAYHPITVFLSCEKNRVGIGINIKGLKFHDDVLINIDDGKSATLICKQYDGSQSTMNCFVEKPEGLEKPDDSQETG